MKYTYRPTFEYILVTGNLMKYKVSRTQPYIPSESCKIVNKSERTLININK